MIFLAMLFTRFDAARLVSAQQQKRRGTSASWLNLVERFFSEITTKRIRRSIFRSVTELKEAIHYTDRHNADPKPSVWTKSAEVILEKERRPRSARSHQRRVPRVGTLAFICTSSSR